MIDWDRYEKSAAQKDLESGLKFEPADPAGSKGIDWNYYEESAKEKDKKKPYIPPDYY